ncbi:MAG: ABC transporter permease, partial [Candidatus Heimdallarchaeota archaeon]|nr:ABC transporter permease [Candidatus Heimdallarchaeota archaeon]
KHLTFRRVVEVPETIINPNGNWDDESYLMHMEWTSEDQGYNYELTYGEEQHNNLSKTIFNDFFAERKINFQYNYTETIDDKEMVTDYRIEEQTAVIGGSWTNFNQPLYLQTNDENQPILPVLRVARALTLMGDVDLFGYSLLVTEGIADMLPAFDNIEGPNLFLLRTNYEYGSQKNIELAKNIEANLNNLDDVNSLSSELGVLIGANTRVTSEEFKAFWEREAAFWDFLGTYAEIGLILGAMGMIIIAARSVSERKREIGMMRSIGFSRREVMVSVALELSVVSVIGLIAGIITGILMSDSVFALIWRVPVVYPIDKFLIYILIVFGITVISAVLPGRNAARIPPSQALRYTG